jgi:hypothetical protein
MPCAEIAAGGGASADFRDEDHFERQGIAADADAGIRSIGTRVMKLERLLLARCLQRIFPL